MQKHMQALDSEFARLQKELNSEICRAFALSGQEKALVDYVEEIVIPLVRGGENQWLFKEAPDPLVEAYARLFVDGFEAYFSASGEYFSATITRNTYLIGINFEITKEKPRCTIRWTNGQDTRDKNNRDNMQIFEKLVNLSFSEISDDIFIRKDVKGFDENSFYVIKPNQYRLWHQATAYLDLNEFSDAILEAGKKQLVEDAEGR